MAATSGSLATNTDTLILTKKPTDHFVIITMSGTYTGVTVSLTGSIDGTNYAPVSFVDRSVFARDTDDSLSSLSTGKVLEVNGSGLKYIKLSCTAISTGSVTAVMNADDVNPLSQLGGG
jgi:hypothetical protein